MKTALNGSDISKLPSGFAQNKEIEYESEKTKHIPIVSYRDCFNKMVQSLDYKGYQLIASPSGKFCGFDVYVKTELEVKGLKQPKDFYYYRKITNADSIEQTNFLSEIRNICEANRNEDTNNKEAQVWERMALSFDDLMADAKSPIAKIAQSKISQTQRIATLSGLPGYHKVLPPLEWFPESLQDFDPTTLLTLLPPAERRQLVLILGRIVAGSDGSQIAEGTMRHTARSYGILVGNQPGLGKSTLLNYIKDALEVLGYATAQVNNNMTKFGWGEVANADLALIDDLTDDLQRELLQSVHVKSIVSNGWLKVEEKGMPAVDIKATSVILGATNLANYAHYIGMDSGSLSRVNQLDTYGVEELKSSYPDIKDARTYQYWQEVAKRLKVTTRLLTIRLLRHCLDTFLEATGQKITDHTIAKDPDLDILESLTKTNRDYFRIDVSLRHSEELPTVISHLVAMAIVNKSDQELLLEALEKTNFNADLLLVLLDLFVNTPKYPSEVQALKLKHLSHSTKKYIRAKLSDFQHLSKARSSDGAFRVVIDELESDKGFKYPVRSSHYQNLWKAQVRLVPTYMKDYKDLDITTLPESIQRAITKTTELLTNTL